jgi:hypothetical protein
MNFNSGAPLTITATGTQTISTVAAQPNIVGALPADFGKVTKTANAVTYFDGYTQPVDPGIANVTTLNGLQSAFTNKAICAGANNVCTGPIFLVNPQPGEVGTLGLTTLKGPKSLSFDMDMIKRFKLREDGRTNFEFRIDAINLLNHPNFGTPVTNINANNTFGRITTATGSRRFVVNTRINF